MAALSDQDPWASSGGGAGATPSEADRILHELRRLRETIVVAWDERAVILSREERHELRQEIKETCDLLTQLTANGA